jgi:uncharacterized LabA/DUF88 family protein
MSIPIANFYIDGFNLYRGCLTRSAYKWLDLVALARQVAPTSRIGRVRFFTARVDGPGAIRQQVYLDALTALPQIVVHTEGHFRTHTVIRAVVPAAGMSSVLESCAGPGARWIPLPDPAPGAWVRASVRDPKEKGTDVNLATMLMADVYGSVCDQAVVISGDSDLQMPVSVAARRMPVTVVNPVFGRRSRQLQAVATRYTTLSTGQLAASQLPQSVRLPGGRVIRKPASW